MRLQLLRRPHRPQPSLSPLPLCHRFNTLTFTLRQEELLWPPIVPSRCPRRRALLLSRCPLLHFQLESAWASRADPAHACAPPFCKRSSLHESATNTPASARSLTTVVGTAVLGVPIWLLLLVPSAAISQAILAVCNPTRPTPSPAYSPERCADSADPRSFEHSVRGRAQWSSVTTKSSSQRQGKCAR